MLFWLGGFPPPRRRLELQQFDRRLGLLAAAEITAHVLDLPDLSPVLRAAITVEESEARLAAAEKRAGEELAAFARKLGIVAARRVVRPH